MNNSKSNIIYSKKINKTDLKSRNSISKSLDSTSSDKAVELNFNNIVEILPIYKKKRYIN